MCSFRFFYLCKRLSVNVNLCELAVPPFSCLENPWHAIRPVTDKYLMILLAQANSQVSKSHLYFTSHPKENTVPLSVVRVLKCNRNLRKEPNANDSCKSEKKEKKKEPKTLRFPLSGNKMSRFCIQNKVPHRKHLGSDKHVKKIDKHIKKTTKYWKK